MEKQLVALFVLSQLGSIELAHATPKDKSLVKQPTVIINPSTQNEAAVKLSTQDPSATIVSKIKMLRNKGKLTQAHDIAKMHLKQYPHDIDVMLYLGLIDAQQKNYIEAESYFDKVLAASPQYVDARVGLIRVKIATKKYDKADILVVQGLAGSPNNVQLIALKKQIKYIRSTESNETASHSTRSVAATSQNDNPFHKMHSVQHVVVPEGIIKANHWVSEKKYTEAKALLKNLVAQYPDDNRFRFALADFYLQSHNDLQAYAVIHEGLKRKPQDVDLLIKQGQIHSILREFALSDSLYQAALAIAPGAKEAKGGIDDNNSISPRYAYGLNEIGIATDNAYVSDVHSVWDYTSIYYNRDTTYGRFTAQINEASRLNNTGAQYMIGFSPRFNRNIYVDLISGFSDKPALFPNRMAGAEAYVNFPGFFELSGGSKYAVISSTHLTTYTGSLNFYPGNYWFSFRPYYFAPQNKNKDAVLYTASARKYFETDDHYIGITAGGGRSPDLADLLTVNFIVIDNSFINVNYQFPILNHKVVVDLGSGYQRWKYPSSLIRNLYDFNVGFKYRF